MDDLTGFQRDLLYVIAGANQPSGQDVKEEIEQYYSDEINHGRLYPNLDTVVNKGLVEKAARSADELLLNYRGTAKKLSRTDKCGNHSISSSYCNGNSFALAQVANYARRSRLPVWSSIRPPE